MSKHEKHAGKPAKGAALKDLKVKKDVKGGCGCMGMPQDPGGRYTMERVQPADLKTTNVLNKAQITTQTLTPQG